MSEVGNVRLHIFDRGWQFELVLQVRLFDSRVWTTIKTLTGKPTIAELKDSINGGFETLENLQKAQPEMIIEDTVRMENTK